MDSRPLRAPVGSDLFSRSHGLVLLSPYKRYSSLNIELVQPCQPSNPLRLTPLLSSSPAFAQALPMQAPRETTGKPLVFLVPSLRPPSGQKPRRAIRREPMIDTYTYGSAGLTGARGHGRPGLTVNPEVR
jgi:hypothetical protein